MSLFHTFSSVKEHSTPFDNMEMYSWGTGFRHMLTLCCWPSNWMQRPGILNLLPSEAIGEKKRGGGRGSEIEFFPLKQNDLVGEL